MTWHDAPLWVLATIAAHALATNAWWWLRVTPSGTGRPARFVRRATGPGPRSAIRAAYLLGPPAAALWLRVVSPEWLGLAAPSGAGAGVTAATMGMAGALTALGANWWYRRADGRQLPRPRAPELADIGWIALYAALLEAHWAFFRAGALATGLDPISAGLGAGLGLLCIESWSSPFARARLSEPASAATLVPTATAAVVSAYTFATTGSSLLAWGIHAAMMVGLATVLPGAGRPDAAADREPVEPMVV